jgi:hypothetical protein
LGELPELSKPRFFAVLVSKMGIIINSFRYKEDVCCLLSKQDNIQCKAAPITWICKCPRSSRGGRLILNRGSLGGIPVGGEDWVWGLDLIGRI